MNPIIETDRLILRHIDMERDFAGFCEAMADAETMRFIGGEPLCRAGTWRSMAMLVGQGIDSDQVIMAAPSWSTATRDLSGSRLDFDIIIE